MLGVMRGSQERTESEEETFLVVFCLLLIFIEKGLVTKPFHDEKEKWVGGGGGKSLPISLLCAVVINE